MIATLAASALLLAPIPAGQAFNLPSSRTCVGFGTLALSPLERFETVSVRAGGKLVKRVTRARPDRQILVRKLPQRSFMLTVKARTRDGRTAWVRKRYTACSQGAKPVVAIPDTAPPATLVVRDVIVGAGAVADPGTLPRVHYFLKTWSNGNEVDASYADPFQFELGSGHVIAGFDQGIAGMRVGGRREIVIPPDLGYGEQGAGGVIKPNETLVFVVDLIEVGR